VHFSMRNCSDLSGPTGHNMVGKNDSLASPMSGLLPNSRFRPIAKAPVYRSYAFQVAQRKRVFHLRSRRELKQFLEAIKNEDWSAHER
jgi:hypothetical protein